MARDVGNEWTTSLLRKLAVVSALFQSLPQSFLKGPEARLGGRGRAGRLGRGSALFPGDRLRKRGRIVGRDWTYRTRDDAVPAGPHSTVTVIHALHSCRLASRHAHSSRLPPSRPGLRRMAVCRVYDDQADGPLVDCVVRLRPLALLARVGLRLLLRHGPSLRAPLVDYLLLPSRSPPPAPPSAFSSATPRLLPLAPSLERVFAAAPRSFRQTRRILTTFPST